MTLGRRDEGDMDRELEQLVQDVSDKVDEVLQEFSDKDDQLREVLRRQEDDATTDVDVTFCVNLRPRDLVRGSGDLNAGTTAERRRSTFLTELEDSEVAAATVGQMDEGVVVEHVVIIKQAEPVAAEERMAAAEAVELHNDRANDDSMLSTQNLYCGEVAVDEESEDNNSSTTAGEQSRCLLSKVIINDNFEVEIIEFEEEVVVSDKDEDEEEGRDDRMVDGSSQGQEERQTEVEFIEFEENVLVSDKKDEEEGRDDRMVDGSRQAPTEDGREILTEQIGEVEEDSKRDEDQDGDAENQSINACEESNQYVSSECPVESQQFLTKENKSTIEDLDAQEFSEQVHEELGNAKHQSKKDDQVPEELTHTEHLQMLDDQVPEELTHTKHLMTLDDQVPEELASSELLNSSTFQVPEELGIAGHLTKPDDQMPEDLTTLVHQTLFDDHMSDSAHHSELTEPLPEDLGDKEDLSKPNKQEPKMLDTLEDLSLPKDQVPDEEVGSPVHLNSSDYQQGDGQVLEELRNTEPIGHSDDEKIHAELENSSCSCQLDEQVAKATEQVEHLFQQDGTEVHLPQNQTQVFEELRSPVHLGKPDVQVQEELQKPEQLRKLSFQVPVSSLFGHDEEVPWDQLAVVVLCLFLTFITMLN